MFAQWLERKTCCQVKTNSANILSNQKSLRDEIDWWREKTRLKTKRVYSIISHQQQSLPCGLDVCVQLFEDRMQPNKVALWEQDQPANSRRSYSSIPDNRMRNLHVL